MFNWIEFGAIGRQRLEPNVRRHYERGRAVRVSLINQDDDEVIPEVFSYMLQEDVHHVCVRVGQNERGHLSQLHTNSAIYVRGRPDYLSWRFGTNSLGSPTGGIAVVDSPKSSLVLCDQCDWAAIIGISLRSYLGDGFRHFF